MPAYYYREARKLADKSCRENISRGLSPCLPVLDDFIGSEQVASAVNLGLVQIPIKFIVGTKTRGRVNAFAPNFMPVLEEVTEFAEKWKSLCQSHLTEGIRDPIKVYEYMNRYYVEEGNKRVSVLKFFDAYNIAAIVYRILPKKTDDEKVQIYYEFVDFYNLSKINYLEFSKKGCFSKLQKAVGKAETEEWSESERREFSGVFHSFEQAYSRNGGDKLKTTVGDAMLSYIEVYGYAALLHESSDEINTNLKKMWEEVALNEKSDAIELKTQPSDEKKRSVFSRMFEHAIGGVMKVAFVYDRTPEKSGWVNDHELGRLHVQRVFEGEIETKAYTNAMDNDPIKIIEKAVEDGNKLIFTTSPRLLNASLRVAIDNPDVVIMNCSLNTSHRYVRTYYTRMYEVKFILGLLAGSLSESGSLGYVCDYPIFGQIAGINAFALGAQMANPRSRVYLEWSGVKGAKKASQALADRGVQYISSQDTVSFLKDDRTLYGLSRVTDKGNDLLALPIWKWDVYYETMLRQMFDNTVKKEYENSDRALNYYWGMSAGVADIVYTSQLPVPSRRYADFFRDSFIHNSITPFITPFNTQDGTVIGENQKTLSLDQIIEMDYLAENVIGSIPAYDELTEMGKATVDSAGVELAQTNSDKRD